jgi:hypothetical protein
MTRPPNDRGQGRKPPEVCPHCGGKNGYWTLQRRRETRTHSWDGTGEDSDETIVLSETKPRCMDCNRRVSL